MLGRLFLGFMLDTEITLATSLLQHFFALKEGALFLSYYNCTAPSFTFLHLPHTLMTVVQINPFI